MDEIRAKRLAKLAANSPSAQQQQQQQQQQPAPSSSSSYTSSAQATSSAVTTATPPVDQPQPAQSPTPRANSYSSSPHGEFQAWSAAQFAHVFGVTLNSEHSESFTFLEGTFTELVEENKDPEFTLELFDRAIIEKLTDHGVPNPFQYLKNAWNEVQKARKTLKQKDPMRVEKLELLAEMDRLTSSYGLVSFQIPDMFANGDVVKFIKDIISNENSYADFLLEIIKRAEEEGTLLDLLNVFIPNLSRLILNVDMNNRDYPLILNIFQLFLNDKQVAAVFTEIDGFKIIDDSIEPSKFETTTILGSIFKLSPLQESVASNNFDRSIPKTTPQIRQIGQSSQAEHRILLERLFFITNKIIRGSNQSRTDLLQYFATIINKNHLRRGDHADFKKLSSNAFVTNIALVLIRLSQPFMDPSLSKIDRIDMNYFTKKNQLIDLLDETRTNSTTAEALEYFDSNKSEEDPNFISDCFFLTNAYLHYGIGGNFLVQNNLRTKIKQLEKSLASIKQQLQKAPPQMRAFGDLQIKRTEKIINDSKAQNDALISFIMDRDLQLEIFDFVSGACSFLVRVIDPNHQYPHSSIKLPLSPDMIGVENVDNTEHFRELAPKPFKYYPEFMVEGLINYVQNISRTNGNPLIRNPRLKAFVEFAVVFLRCPELIGNPHLKGRLVESLFSGTVTADENTPGFMTEITETDQLVIDHLLYALLDFYVVVEKTGSSTQFYDKFNSRFQISCILEQLWKNPVYQNELYQQSKNNEEFFIRFVARMLNDLTFLLDESLRQLVEIHKLQTELENRSKQLPNDMEGTNEELERNLSSAEGQAKSYVNLANHSIKLFDLFTREVPRAFMKAEIVGRLASMLDYNLEALVGPKCSGLKVKNPQDYQFNARNLLVTVVKIYINLADQEEFIKSVAQDSRSFKVEYFERAESIILRRNVEIAPDDLIKFNRFAKVAESKRLEEEQEEAEMGEIPDEFLDPLMFTLMEDPVILPSSKVTIDRSTIRAHLLSDSTDPFNRVPLKLEDVVPNEELKKQILDFRAKSKKTKREDEQMTDV